jgi:hypothetical protein
VLLDAAPAAAAVRPAVGVCAARGAFHGVGTVPALAAEPEVDGAGAGRLATLAHDEPVD